MAKISRSSDRRDEGPVLVSETELGDYAVNFITFKTEVDHSPLLKGLPGDQCPCPHWGYVIEGKITFSFGDSEETYEAGDAFYTPPGHIPVVEAGTEYVLFSPVEEHKQVTEAIQRNLQAMRAAQS